MHCKIHSLFLWNEKNFSGVLAGHLDYFLEFLEEELFPIFLLINYE